MSRWRTYASPTYRAGLALARPVVAGLTRRRWRGQANVPQEGGFLVASNHISNVDPIVLGHFLVELGVVPHFLAKDSLFRAPVLGWMMRDFEMVPVQRGTARARDSLVAAEQALAKGDCVIIMPEGTHTKDPGLWPERGKSGIARVALTTGVPVIPIATWGAQEIMPPKHRGDLVRRRLRHDVSVSAGPAVELSDLRARLGREEDLRVYREATDRIMAAVVRELESIRGPRGQELS